jgi:DNA-binding transcriptional LysR family regulator
MNVSVELRQLRYFVAVAEELHFGRAAERLHMSQSPLSRAIRELERELGVVLFVRTTRRVALTPAGCVLLERSRRALAEIDGAIVEARRSARAEGDVLEVGYGPFSRTLVTAIAEALEAERPDLGVRVVEEVTPESLRRVGSHELAAAVVMETPAAARLHGLRVDTLSDEPLLAALPQAHRCAALGVIPLSAFAAERVLLPREPPGQMFNAWLRAVLRAHGVGLERTVHTVSAPWDRRMPLVAGGEAVSVLVAEWVGVPIPGVVAVPFDPPLSFPTDLVSRWPPTEGALALVGAACRVRDAEGWLTQRTARIELPGH